MTTELQGLLVAIATIASASGAAAPDASDAQQLCSPAATVEGDSAEAVAAVLRQRGIAEPAPGCQALQARIVVDEQGFIVTVIDDETGTTTQRRASTAAAAATIVESWARRDVASDLLAPRAPPPAPPPVVVVVEQSVPAVTPPAPPWIFFDAVAETNVAFDGSVWPGVAAGVCFHLGPVCAGGLGRAAVDTSFSGASSDQETGRVALDGYLGLDASFDVAGVSVRPGAFVGAGWMQSRNSPVWATPPANNVEIDNGGMRGGARVLVGVPLGEKFVLDLSVGADLALLAHTATFVEEGETIAGEPLGFVRFGVGFGARR